jgi:hypothetical protein
MALLQLDVWINSSLMLSKTLLICKYCSVIDKRVSKY